MFLRAAVHIALVFLFCVDAPVHTEAAGGPHNSAGGPDPVCEPVAEIRVREGFGHLYRGAQQRGELCLHRLAQTALREDAWIYTQGFWVDVGYGEEPRSVNCTWEAVRSLPDISAGSDLVWYHIHPQCAEPQRIHPPSYEDIFGLARFELLCRETFTAELTAKVFDGAGVWTVELSETTRQCLCWTDPSADQPEIGLIVTEKRQRELAKLAFLLAYKRCVEEVLENPIFDRSETIRRFVLCMNEIGVQLSYQELD